MNDGKQFLVIDIIVAFRFRQGFGEVGTWVPFVIIIFHGENYTSGKIRSISINAKEFLEVSNAKNRIFIELLFEVIKGMLLGGAP